MPVRSAIVFSIFSLVLCGSAWAQLDSTEPAPTQETAPGIEGVPIDGESHEPSSPNQDNDSSIATPARMAESQWVTVTDTTLGDLPSAPSSFFLAGVNVSQNVQRQPTSAANSPQVVAYSNVYGNVRLVKFYRRSESAAVYAGGGTISSFVDPQYHHLILAHRLFWRNTQLAFGDSFGKFPGGRIITSAFDPGIEQQLGFPRATNFTDSIGNSSFAQPSETPHLANVAVAELDRTLSARASWKSAAAFSFTSYSGGGAIRLVNSHQVTSQTTYNYAVSERNSIGVTYSYRNFQFPKSGAGALSTNLIQVVFSRQLSKSLDFSAGAGPEFVSLSARPSGDQRTVSASGYSTLSYKMENWNLSASYSHQISRGYGFFAGATSDAAHLIVARSVAVRWETSLQLSYARSTALQASLTGVKGARSDYGFAELTVRRDFGRQLSAFAEYQLSDEIFGAGSCLTSSVCALGGVQNTFALGVSWRMRPLRIN